MDCVNHSGVTATAFCQNCGKAICANCVRNGAGGQILCEPCWVAWQNIPNPFAPPPIGVPNPATAAVLGLIPGVGAMYNGQFFKGLIHVVIFAVLISITTHYGIFGIFIGAWVLYQSFEAFHTAKARRDGQPLPDPLGLNEVGNWLNLGAKPNYPGQPGAPYQPGAPNPGPASVPGAQGGYPPPYAGQYQAPYQTPYQAPPYPPAPGFAAQATDPAAPPIPPPPQALWRRKEPIGAIVLIGLGLLFLLGQLDDIGGRVFEFTWPLLLIGLGVWLVVRRMGDNQGGPR
jgi:TM2 domain-containing membrane protein YozV